MSVYKDLEKDPKETLIKQAKALRAGMLGVQGSTQHMQPMTHYPDWDAGEIWFITSKETDLVKQLPPDAMAHFCLMGGDQDFQACLSGMLSEVNAPQKLEELWSPIAAAWFEGGKEDPNITLLRMTLREAALWGSSSSALKFGIEIAKANMKDEHLPDVGTHKVISF
ncbi:pyridoxamine 5'-phosphate oxidase family protein [Thioclava kandeliae]|uniref:Pyridoxamine 5'-phosphate oxidase family protein n=1 Tax=Thioclava kandeliae TaxID=3070818 RepID=A0ABV1SI68_9RHOB